MTHHVTLQFAARTDRGLVRAHNEDAIEFSQEDGIAVLADGMGGYNAGEIASGIATATFCSKLEQRLKEIDSVRRSPSSKVLQKLMIEAVNAANIGILEAAANQPEYAGMGTTLVAALFHQNRVLLAHVGDSRAYRFRNGTLTQLTRDHSQLQEQIDAGLVSPEWARFAPNKNLITRALGVMPQVEVETSVHFVEQGDIYLLCSDGLSDMLSTAQIVELLAQPIGIDVMCDQLIEVANNHGGRDNISVILSLVEQLQAKSAHPRIKDRVMGWFKN